MKNNQIPRIEPLVNQSQGRLSNLSSSTKKPSLTERINKGKVNLKMLIIGNVIERNKTGHPQMIGG
jgi:hypothetical protein